VNDPRIGASYRVLRRRKGWRQRDVGKAAGVSQSVVSRIEAGHIDQMTISTLRTVAGALDSMFVGEMRWKGGALERLLDERHSALVGATVATLTRYGWVSEVEVSYSHYGERGSIDIVAWHQQTATLLVVEVKTELISVEATLRKLDEKVRLAPIVRASEASGQGGPPRPPSAIGRLLVLPDTTTSRRHLARHEGVLGMALPLRGMDVRAWIRRPVGAASGVMLVPEGPGIREGNAKRGGATPHRIRRPATSTSDDAIGAIDARRGARHA
jgi:transcriptional regulator with XRE-family HTH domain